MTTITTEPSRRSRAHVWRLDPDASTVEFHVPTFWGLHTVAGRFSSFDGSYVDEPDDAAIELNIDATSLDTGNAFRDRHLRSEDFFDVDGHPQVRFTSTQIERHGASMRVSGRLEVAARTVPVAVDAKVRELGDALEIEGSTTVDYRELGMTHSPLKMIRTPATLHVKVRLEPDER